MYGKVAYFFVCLQVKTLFRKIAQALPGINNENDDQKDQSKLTVSLEHNAYTDPGLFFRSAKSQLEQLELRSKWMCLLRKKTLYDPLLPSFITFSLQSVEILYILSNFEINYIHSFYITIPISGLGSPSMLHSFR